LLHFTYEARRVGIQLQHNSNLLCYKKTLENLVTSSSSLKKQETKSQVVKQVARAVSLRATTTAGKLDHHHHHHGLTFIAANNASFAVHWEVMSGCAGAGVDVDKDG